MANTWYLYYTFAPCGNTVHSRSYSVNGLAVRDFGSLLVDCALINPESDVRDPMISWLRTNGWWPGIGETYDPIYLTDADTIFTNGNLYYDPSAATHIIQYHLASNQYIADIEAHIVEISTRLASELSFLGSPVEYIKTELDRNTNTLNVFVRHTSPTLTYSPYGVLEDIESFALRAIVAIITIIVAALVASIILSGGYTAAAIAYALVTGSAILIVGYRIYTIVDKHLNAEVVIKNLTAFQEITTKKDATIAGLEQAYNNSTKTDADCLVLLKGYKQTHLSYLSEFANRLPKLTINTITKSYTACADDSIAKRNAGTIACDTARTNIGSCATTAFSQTGSQFQTVYDPNANYDTGTDWTTYAVIVLMLGVGYYAYKRI